MNINDHGKKAAHFELSGHLRTIKLPCMPHFIQAIAIENQQFGVPTKSDTSIEDGWRLEILNLE